MSPCPTLLNWNLTAAASWSPFRCSLAAWLTRCCFPWMPIQTWLNNSEWSVLGRESSRRPSNHRTDWGLKVAGGCGFVRAEPHNKQDVSSYPLWRTHTDANTHVLSSMTQHLLVHFKRDVSTSFYFCSTVAVLSCINSHIPTKPCFSLCLHCVTLQTSCQLYFLWWLFYISLVKQPPNLTWGDSVHCYHRQSYQRCWGGWWVQPALYWGLKDHSPCLESDPFRPTC